MPAKSSHNAEPHTLAHAVPSTERHDPEAIAAGPELTGDLEPPGADDVLSPAGRRAAERTARRQQRAEAPGAPVRPGYRSPNSRLTPARASLVRASLPLPLIALIAGGVLGVILDALSVNGWVIGLLAAALTVVVFQALGSHSDSTRAGTE